MREGERAMSVLPAAEDPVYGPIAEEYLAGVEAQVGELDRAIGRIERLLTTPYGAFRAITPAHAPARSRVGPIRNDPRFQALVAAETQAVNTGNFFAELKRRNVYKVAVAYAVMAWLLIQAGSILFPTSKPRAG